MSEVEPRLKPSGPCGCGCDLDGIYRVKPWKDGTLCVARGCKCKRCQGRRNSRMGANAQRKGKKALGLKTAGSIHTGHEEHDMGDVRWESKFGPKFTGPMFTAYVNAETQSETSRAVGDNRPFVFYARNARGRYGLITFREDKMDEVIIALGKARGLIE